MRWLTLLVRLTLAAGLSLGCGSKSSAPATSPTVLASQRLEGNWRLLSFEPSLAMEEPLKGLLDAQLKTLTITFSNGQFTAQGPGVNSSGRYEVTSAQGDSLSGRVYDSAGAGYTISGQFIGPQFRFMSQGQSFAGTGILERVQ